MKLAASLLIIVVLFMQTLAQSGTNKQPLSHATMWQMKRVGAPQVSPDGRWAVFAVAEPAYEEKEQSSDLWLVSTENSSKPRRLTSSKSGESGIAWSPDNQKVAFSAKREGDEVAQIYSIDITGGEAVRLTSLSTGARSPRWSPDGKQIAFTSTVYPGAKDDEENKKIAAERKAQKYRARVYNSFPVRQWDKWLDDMQTHLFVQDAEPKAKAKDLLASTKLVGESGYSGKAVLSSEELDTEWSPDGQSILFVATTSRNRAAYDEPDLHIYQVAVTGSEPKKLTKDGFSASKPIFSPNGQFLLFNYNENNSATYNHDKIAKVNWPEVTDPQIVTKTFDRSVSNFVITPDSAIIYLLAEDSGHEKLYSLSVSGGEVKQLFETSSGCYTNLTISDKSPLTLIANWESAVNPPEVVKIDTRKGGHTSLSDFNAKAVAEIDWQPVRHFWFTNKAGKKVHNMIALPPNFDENRKYPLFSVIHGGPYSMWRDQFVIRWNYHLMAQPGYVVLLTNYTGSTGFGEEFSRALKGNPLSPAGDDLNQAVEEAIKQFKFIDPDRVAAGGASYGGHLANWLQATTTRYKCLISHAGLINLESQWGTSDTIYSREVTNGGPVWEQNPTWRQENPIRYAKNFRTPILVTVGENDFRVPLNQSLENWSVLQRLQIPSRLIVFPEENHWIMKGENSKFFYQEVHAWLKKYLETESVAKD